MATVNDRKHKVFPMSVLMQYEKELLLKHLDGFFLSEVEKARLAKLILKLKARG